MTKIMKEERALIGWLAMIYNVPIGAGQQKAVRGKIVANWANLLRL